MMHVLKNTCLVQGRSKRGEVVLIGFYGSTLGGFVCQLRRMDSLGPERVITKAVANILYEIDGQPALDLYKKNI
jgi:hypothetical protein